MPVIREDRKYSIGPIGVARLASPVPSSNGSQVIAEAVASAADNMADRFFREGAKKAEQFGIEQGSSASREAILAIDPATGAPKAYETPKGFGTIAQDAYQRVILTRFQSSVEEEIRLKAKELAATYDGSVDRYTAAMSEYIGAMTVNADGQFQTYIQDVGTSYLNATRTAMAIDQINRERSAAANAQGASIAAGNDALRTLVASYGAESIFSGSSENPTPAYTIHQSVNVAVDDGVKSEIFTQEDALKFGRDKNMAAGAGQIEFLASQTTSSTEAMRLHAAISSGDLSLISDGPLRTVMSTLSYEDRGKLEKVSYDFLKERADYLKIDEDLQASAYKASGIVAASKITANATASGAVISRNAFSYPIPAVIDVTRTSYTEDTAYAAQLEEVGRTDEATAYKTAAKIRFDAAVVGVFSRALVDADSADTDAIERAVRNLNPSMAPPDKVEVVSAIIELNNVDSGVIKSFGSFAQSHREDTGKLLTEQKQLAAFVEANGLVKDVSISMANLSPADLETTYSTAQTAIINSSMDADKKISLGKELANSAAIASLSNVFRFQQPPTPAQMNAMQTYISDGIDTGALTPPQIEALNRVRKYQGISENPSSVTTKLNDYIQETEKAYTQIEKEKEKFELFRNIQVGQADGSLRDVRVAADDLLKSKHSELGGFNLGDLISNGSLFSDSKNANALNSLGGLTVMPESVLQVFRNASTGAISGDRLGFTLRAWNELRFTTDQATGADIFSPAVRSAMTADDIAKLDMMSGAYTMSGFSVEKVQEAINLYDNYKNNPVYKTKVEERLGVPLEVFVSQLDGIDGAMPQDVAAITAAALGLVGSSEVTRVTTDGIKDKLESQLNLSYPNDGNVMNGYGGLRSAAAPSAVLGQLAPQWNTFVLDYVKRSGFSIDGEKISKVKLADLNDINRMSGPSTISVGALGGIPAPSDRDTKQIFLQPVGSSTSDGTYYNIMLWRPQAEGGPVALRQEMTISSPNGPRDGLKVYPVMTLNTKDPDFLRAVELNEARLQVEGQATADRRRKVLTLAANVSTFTPNPFAVGAIFAGSILDALDF